jgi:NAD(P)H-hydrate epimerase
VLSAGFCCISLVCRWLRDKCPWHYQSHPKGLGKRTNNRQVLCCQFLDQSAGQCTVILKGVGTVIASHENQVWINTTGNPGMATAGMGDVLSGVVGALICQGLCPQEAARAAVYLHGRAGDLLLNTIGIGYIATELADSLPQAIKLMNP